MSDIDKIKELIIAETGASVEDLEYVTEELVAELSDAVDEDTSDPDGLEEEEMVSKDGVRILAGVYCNSLTIDSGSGGYIRYKRGQRGTTNYGCGNRSYRVGKQGTRIQRLGSCSGGRKKYLVTW